METFIAQRIIENAKISEAKGQAKYRAYFVKTKIYSNWKAEVDTILETDGYDYCIVTA